MLMDAASFWAMLPTLMRGLLVTIAFTLSTVVIGMLFALPVALARNSRNRLLRTFGALFIFFFRGPPLLVQLYLVYYGLPQFEWVRESFIWTLLKEPVGCAVVALSLNSAGYVAEILASALRNVPHGEVEAAAVAGFPATDRFRLVILPHMARIALRSYGNELIFIIKGTSVASLVTVIDLMGAAQIVYFRTYDPFTPLLAAGAIYFALVFSVTRGIAWLERRLSPEYRLRGVAR
jgi:His/Glu/Gln/Arg/opine family amino acid ABC transporter permease subunit